MHVTLICPAMGHRAQGPGVGSWKMQPLVLAVLAGLTPEDWEVRAVDDRLEPIPWDEPTDLVGITVEAFTARRAYEIADGFRDRGVKVVLGGYHATLMPEEAGRHADALVIGEAEEVWGRILADVAAGHLQPCYVAPRRAPPGLIRQRRGVLAGKRYLPLKLVESSRGCVHRCRFCSVTAFFDASFTRRPVEDLVREIEHLDGGLVFLVDDNFVAHPESARHLCRELEPLGIRWVTQASLTMALDPELLALMARSGCGGVLIGFESMDPGSLMEMDKSWNQDGLSYREAVRRIYDHGISIYASFALGFDHDDAGTLERTLEFALESRFFLAGFNRLQPYPGTPLYADLERQQRLIRPRWWLDPGYRFGEVVFQPARLTADELSRGCDRLRRRFYSLGAIMRRGLNVEVNTSNPYRIGTYLFHNLLARWEIDAKARARLGSAS